MHYAEEVPELERLEHEHHADPPEPATAAFMAASALRGKRHHVATDATMRTLGLDICAGALPLCCVMARYVMACCGCTCLTSRGVRAEVCMHTWMSSCSLAQAHTHTVGHGIPIIACLQSTVPDAVLVLLQTPTLAQH